MTPEEERQAAHIAYLEAEIQTLKQDLNRALEMAYLKAEIQSLKQDLNRALEMAEAFQKQCADLINAISDALGGVA